jgi:glycogen synthase
MAPSTHTQRPTSRSRQPRVLWMTERYPPLDGGMASSCERVVRGLRARDVQVDLVLFQSGAEPRDPVVRDRDNGVDLAIGRESSHGLATQLVWSHAKERSSRHPYTCVVGFGANFPGFVAVTFAAWLGVPSMVLVRGNDLDRDWFDPKRGPWVREALARATLVGAVSREKVSRVKALNPDVDAVWTPNGIEPEAWTLLAADAARRDELREIFGEGRRVVGLFGELKYKKRVPLWLGALRDAGLRDRVGLLVAGRADEATQQILDDPVLSPLKHQLPFVTGDALPALYAACDYVAIPSLVEGMPNVLLEAMAMGVIPITSDAGGMADVVTHGETGFVFPAEDRVEAARVTAEALSLPEQELKDMSERVAAVVRERHTTEKTLSALKEILLRLPARARHRRLARGLKPGT